PAAMPKPRTSASEARRALLSIALALLTVVSSAAQTPPPSPRAEAPRDITGYWVSVVTEDWRWRMGTPRKGDFESLPLNDDGRKIANIWEPAKDAASGNACKSYGAAAIMRVPGRIHITWENDTTLKLETDAGTQTRRLLFGRTSSRGWRTDSR